MDGVFGVDCLSNFAVSLVVALLQRKLSRWYAVTNIFVRDGITIRIKKKDAPFHLLIKLTQKVLKIFFRGSDFEDFQIIFHSRPIPDLYL